MVTTFDEASSDSCTRDGKERKGRANCSSHRSCPVRTFLNMGSSVAVGWLVVLFEVTCSTRASAESDWIGCRFAAMWSCQTCEGAISGGNGSSRQAFKCPRASAIMVWLSISHTLLHDSSFL